MTHRESGEPCNPSRSLGGALDLGSSTPGKPLGGLGETAVQQLVHFFLDDLCR
jgi:hypothetical protein